MASPEDLRAAALAQPEAIEVDHIGAASWRVRGKIFAQLTQQPGRGILKLPKPRQEWLFEVRPAAFSPCVWGRLVWCNVELPEVETGELAGLVKEAWGAAAPEALAEARAVAD